jgi:hypothetical protein
MANRDPILRSWGYHDSVVKFDNTNSLVRFENKKVSSVSKNVPAYYNAGVVVVNL